jgi:alkyl hydroperoxide reductase subunit AhpC
MIVDVTFKEKDNIESWKVLFSHLHQFVFYSALKIESSKAKRELDIKFSQYYAFLLSISISYCQKV